MVIGTVFGFGVTVVRLLAAALQLSTRAVRSSIRPGSVLGFSVVSCV